MRWMFGVMACLPRAAVAVRVDVVVRPTREQRKAAPAAGTVRALPPLSLPGVED